MPGDHGDRFTVRVGGEVSGQTVVGDGNVVNRTYTYAAGPVTAEELDDLRAAFDELRSLLAGEAGDQSELARQKIDELEQAITAEEPEVVTMEAIQSWFSHKLPRLADSVNSLILNPIVTRLIAAAGDHVAAEFTHRFL